MTAPRWSRWSWWRNRPIAIESPGNEQPRYWRALVEYDGTSYYGFQVQAHRPTIQGSLEEVLARLTGERIRIRYAGRTDTGVHAVGQVISFYASWRHTAADLERAWNALLPADIAVRRVEPVADQRFHPRYSARSRVYRYTVWTAPWRSPMHSRYSLHEPRPLDIDSMNQAARSLIGEHDFAAFGQPTQGESTVRRVAVAEWWQLEESTNSLLLFTIEANAFLRRMVRSVVGTLLEVGKGFRSVDSVAEVLAGCDRRLAAPPAPACGLCLMEVKY